MNKPPSLSRINMRGGVPAKVYRTATEVAALRRQAIQRLADDDQAGKPRDVVALAVFRVLDWMTDPRRQAEPPVIVREEHGEELDTQGTGQAS